MSEITHRSIGARDIERENAVKEKEQERTDKIEKIITRYNVTPLGYQVDQMAFWFLCFLVASSVFLFCTVSVVRLALR